MSYTAMKEQLQDGCGFKVKHAYVDEHDYNCENVMRETEDSFFDRVREAYNHAIQEGIEVNSIFINKNIVKVPAAWISNGISSAIQLPPMICGLHVYLTENVLPKTYSFALTKGPSDRLEQFESIGMEPDELRKAAEMYRRIKEVIK